MLGMDDPYGELFPPPPFPGAPWGAPGAPYIAAYDPFMYEDMEDPYMES